MKRFFLVFLSVGVLTVGVVLLWQPEALQHKVLDLVTQEVERSTPYILSAKTVSGNFFTHFSLNDLQIRAKGKTQDLATAKSLDISLKWMALFHKKMEISQLRLNNPVVKLVMGKDHRLDLPSQPAPVPDKKAAPGLPLYVERLDITNGRMTLVNTAVTPPQEVVLHPVNLAAKISPQALTIEDLSVGIEEGRLQVKGDVTLPALITTLSLKARQFPLHQLLKLSMAPPKALRLKYSGQGHVLRKDQDVDVQLKGQLEGAPLRADAHVDLRGPLEGKIDLQDLSVSNVWTDPSFKKVGKLSATLSGANHQKGFQHLSARGNLHLARESSEARPDHVISAELNVVEGRGPLSWIVKMPGLSATGVTHPDLPAQTMDGKFELAVTSFTSLSEYLPALAEAQGQLKMEGSWKGPWSQPSFIVTGEADDLAFKNRGLEELNMTASGVLGPRPRLKLDATAKDIRPDLSEEGSWDISSAKLHVEKSSSVWHPVLAASFRNKSTLNYAGTFQQMGQGWQLTWDSLELAPQKGPSLKTAQAGQLRRSADGTLDAQGLVLASGAGLLYVDRAHIRMPSVDIAIRTNAWDPSAVSAFIPESTIDAGGSIRMKATITGNYPQVEVNGDIEAHVPRMRFPAAGLDLKNFNADVISRGRTLIVRECTADTKKGSIRMTGASTLPELNLYIEGKRFALEIPKKLEAVASLRLLISGDIEGPDISGSLRIFEATYTAPKKNKKDKKEEETGASSLPTLSVWEGTTMDVRAEWPRNVWYRDGLSKIETSGDLRVQKDEGAPNIYLSGSISIVRGTYSAYGRDFILSSGDIAFTGPPVINPILNIEATYKSGGTIVYLDLKGTAKAPELTLRSNPPLPQQDIISVLVLGQPMNQVQPGPAGPQSSNAQAGAAAGSVLGSLITTQLRESGMDILGLDMVRVEPTTQGNVLMVGRYIGSNLFVSYGQPLQATASRAYEAKYYISPNWTMVGQSGSPETAQVNTTGIDNHVGFEFRYPLNTPRYGRGPRRDVVKTPAPEPGL